MTISEIETPPAPIGTAEDLSFAEAICRAQADAMAEDPSIVLLGQDVEAGFPFGATKGLVDRFGAERVRNTPISEAATMGCGVGLAIGGMRPVVEVDFSGFLLLGMDQLINNAAKLRYMSGGQISVPMVVRVGQGPLPSFGAQHSQTQHAFLASIPGLSVLTPATPQDAYDGMRWALRQADPVVVAEDMRLYPARGEVVPSAQTRQPGVRTVRSGSDATVITFGYGVGVAQKAALELADQGIDVELLSLTSLSPLDVDTIGESARRTRRVLVLTDDPPYFGVGASLSSVVTEAAFDTLESGVIELGSRPVPAPYAPNLEKLVYPGADVLVEAVTTLVGRS